MKKTIETPDPLLDQVRKIAARDGETLRSLVEQGLRKVVAERSAKGKPARIALSRQGAPCDCRARCVGFGVVHDARIAAICLDNGVRELWSADRDFNRFPSLTVRNPLID